MYLPIKRRKKKKGEKEVENMLFYLKAFYSIRKCNKTYLHLCQCVCVYYLPYSQLKELYILYYRKKREMEHYILMLDYNNMHISKEKQTDFEK